MIPFADVMKVSDEESLLLTGKNSYEEAAEELLSMGPELIAITLGSDGVLVATTRMEKNRSGDLQQRRLIQQEPEIHSGVDS